MTEHTPEGGGTPLSFKKVQDPTHFERAPAPTPAGARQRWPQPRLRGRPARAAAPGHRARPSDPQAVSARATATTRARRPPPFEAPPPVEGTGVRGGPRLARRRAAAALDPHHRRPSRTGRHVGSGQSGRQRLEHPQLATGHSCPTADAAATAEGAAWETRDLPNANRDRSAWAVPDAPRSRKLSGRKFLGIALTVVLVAILGFAGYEWFTGRAHPAHTISTPVSGRRADRDPHAGDGRGHAADAEGRCSSTAPHASSAASTAAPDAPTLVVLLAQGSNIETSTTQFFTDFTTGLKTQGVIVSSRRDDQHHGQAAVTSSAHPRPGPRR